MCIRLLANIIEEVNGKDFLYFDGKINVDNYFYLLATQLFK